MAKSKAVNKISDKLVKVSESFQVYMYDNAYMIEVSGRDSDGDYKTVKLMVPTLEQLQALIKEVTEMERDD
jgi:putative lipoic acid-binding regulatory protein